MARRNIPASGRKRGAGLMTVLLFFVMLCVSVGVTFSYGQAWDERVEMGIAVANIREYAAWAGVKEAGDPGDPSAVRISEHIDRDHGAAAYYGFYPIYQAVKASDRSVMIAWHLYTSLLFFAGVIAVYFLLRELFSHPVVWWLGTLSYYLTPRFFAEGHYNNKDLVFVSLLLMMLLFLIRVTRAMTWKHLIPYVIVSGFLMNCRILGVVFWAFGGLAAIVYQLIFRRHTGVWGKIGCGFAASVLCYFLLTPAAWGDPAGFLRYSVENAAHFSRWNRVILFSGNMIRPAEEGMPFSYLPKWIAMTTPVHVLALFALTCIMYVPRLVRDYGASKRAGEGWRISERDYFVGMLLLLFWAPFGYLVVKSRSVVLYNSWRHAYFLYVPMILCFLYPLDAAAGMAGGWKKQAGKYLLSAVAVMGLLSAAADVVYYHPYQYMYFNRLSRSILSPADYEGDYWNVSTLSVLREFEAEHFQGEKLKVALMVDAGGGQSGELLNSEKLEITDAAEADYYLFNVSMLQDGSLLEGYEMVSGAERGGAVISGVFRKLK